MVTYQLVEYYVKALLRVHGDTINAYGTPKIEVKPYKKAILDNMVAIEVAADVPEASVDVVDGYHVSIMFTIREGYTVAAILELYEDGITNSYLHVVFTTMPVPAEQLLSSVTVLPVIANTLELIRKEWSKEHVQS